MKMVKVPTSLSKNSFRAYVNSVIHNRFVFMASYGDDIDQQAKRVYENALPGYEIILVDAMNTKWGDSVHCRSRNKHKAKANFLFPKVRKRNGIIELDVEVVRTFNDGSELEVMKVYWKFKGGEEFASNDLKFVNGNYQWIKKIIKKDEGKTLQLYVKLKDTKGRVKTAPIVAKLQTIDIVL